MAIPRTVSKTILVIACGFLVGALLSIDWDDAEHKPIGVKIAFQSATNSSEGNFAFLTVSNETDFDVQRGRFCTVYYYSNSIGISNESVVTFPTNQILKPHDVETVRIKVSSGADVWQSSFVFRRRQPAINDIVDRLPVKVKRDERVFVILGPKVRTDR